MGSGVDQDHVSDSDIAIVGMAAHLPGAANLTAYWSNLREGVESIRRLSESELLAAGESPERMRHRNYVAAAAPLEGFGGDALVLYGDTPFIRSETLEKMLAARRRHAVVVVLERDGECVGQRRH